MKKTLLILLIIFPLFVNAQTPYYDAMIIAKYIGADDTLSSDSVDEVIYLKILNNYFKKPLDSFTINQVIKKYTEPNSPNYNPFLADLLPVATGGGAGSDSKISKSSIAFPSSLGGLDVTTLADGLAKFIVKRTKQELNMAFFNKFQKLLADPKLKDLQTIFPQTSGALNTIGSEIYNYTAYLQTLREAFNNDLSTLAAHLPSIIVNHPEFFELYPQLGALLQSGCYIATGINDKKHPGDILAEYPSEFLDPLHNNWKASIKTLHIVSASLRDTAQSPDSSYWVSPQQIQSLVKDTIAFRIFMGLVYQQAKNKGIVFTSDTTHPVFLTTILWDGFKNYNAYKNYFLKFSEKASSLSRMIKAHQKKAGDSLTVEQYTSYFDASVDLLEYASQASDLMPAEWKNIPDKKYLFYLKDTLSRYFDIAHSSSRLVLAINRKHYAIAIMNIVHIYDLIYSTQMEKDTDNANIHYKKAIKELRKKGGAKLVKRAKSNKLSPADSSIHEIMSKASMVIEKRAYKAAIKGLRKEGGQKLVKRAKSNELFPTDTLTLERKKKVSTVISMKKKEHAEEVSLSSKNTLNTILKYGTFMATLVQAETSDEVATAIESFALPPGSSRIKRESPFNVSINSYPGLFIGYEQIQGLSSDKCVQLNSYGVTAPVGVAISFGKAKFIGMLPVHKNEKHWSYTAFISIVDLGAVAAFRFNNDNNTAQVPKIQLKDIVSPGLFFSLGIPKCPVSINLGAQVGPNLRNVSGTGNDYSDNAYIRYSMSFAVDIPLLNLYTKSR